MGLLRTLFIIALIYFVFKALRIYVFPVLGRMLLKKAQQKMQENMQSQFQQGRAQQQQGNRQQDQGAEGDVKVFKKPGNDKKIKNDTVGDYVDFEEVD